MDILVTGATGVLGRVVVQQLVAAGHHVRGLTRSTANVATVEELGAEPFAGSLWNRESLRQAARKRQVIMHLATKIPPLTQSRKRAAWQENDRIRREGARTLVDAALAEQTQSVIYPSICAAYPDSGADWIDATTHAPLVTDYNRSTFDAEAEIQRFITAGGRGVTLRLGLLYGPASPQSQAQMRYARHGIAAVTGKGGAYHPYLAITDAASALVAALADAPSGVYDIVEDTPQTTRSLAQLLAAVVGRKRLWIPPTWLFALTTGKEIATASARSQRVSNARFKAVTTWAPRIDSTTGWAAVAQATS
jgi:nucleoside-diphosphate-sugar epimerase